MASWRPHRLRTSLLALVVPIAAAGMALRGSHAHADAAGADAAEQHQRCAVRLSIALLGKSPDPALMSSADPQSNVDAMLGTPEFADRYARFINATFNSQPATSPTTDPIYYLASHVITQKKPWTDLFIGPYQVTAAGTTSMTVTDDPTGLGFYGTRAWMQRYAGNEEAGVMLVAAFRTVQTTTGLMLTPSIGKPGEDRSADTRQTGVCKGCHYDPWFAIDTVASLLPTRVGTGSTMTFKPPSGTPAKLLGKSMATYSDLVHALVDSDAWRFNQCRRVFQFLYGRDENQCESATFDACVDALNGPKTIQAAVAAVAKDPSFCGN
jgi:hypothetical protein